VSLTDPDSRRRRELAEFLRNRRQKLVPTDLGLASRRRTRTPGLRREDVAARAGVSVAWYTNLEQARAVNPSRTVIKALSSALQLDSTESDYLHSLAGYPLPEKSNVALANVEVLQTLFDLVAAPAYCTDALTNVIAWNFRAAELFGDYGSWPPERRNLLTLLFDEPDFAPHLLEREVYASRVVASFRGRSDAYLHDPAAIALLDSLRDRSPLFERTWQSVEVRRSDMDTLTAQFENGRRVFTLVCFQALSNPAIRLNAYVPEEPSDHLGPRPFA
jgi:transcriptional regulator with XRE-family HTH domain